MDNCEIIENTEEARNRFQDRHQTYGGSEMVLTAALLRELRAGKVLAIDDGEYATFVTYSPKGKQP